MSNIGNKDYDSEEDFYEMFLRAGDGEFVDMPATTSIKQQIVNNNRHLDFCLEIIYARSRKGLTQTALAEMIGSNKSVIHGAESRRGNPRLLTLLLIAEALGMRLTLTQ